MSDVLKPKQACEFLGISESALYRHAGTGQIPGQKIGSIWRFSKKALEDWLGQYDTKTDLNQLKIRLFNAEEKVKELEGVRHEYTNEN
ncbi:TPA: helix-turn-helix domain-containing protein [Listeria monocytogenes]|uniref:helix-turn-helix domain-containing protein n=1 Tax=Listeria monocytogenes TaxID=1639 RepID=UPI000BDF399C|nr:helix-turn-helix domain-containing protein [Listeria monocytogenes]EHC5243273.1 helix-turn-helix domain-containing protein [Listeria monocytogenes serotype 1/2a]EAC2245287.1 DNA-binding protein [Listeria monocytogenes]EAC2299770.1 DNA-binding protein [Listeria monocytogenes]EAC2921684.1 DNA-binding protein [Listeria monocytogenes]EAC3423709.1 DNA-binding protein [Listeria monocytogenes]